MTHCTLQYIHYYSITELKQYCSQRLSLLRLLRRLNCLGVSAQITELVYITHIESVLTFHLSAWFDHLNSKLKKKLNRIVSMASKIVGNHKNHCPKYILTERGIRLVKSLQTVLTPFPSSLN